MKFRIFLIGAAVYLSASAVFPQAPGHQALEESIQKELAPLSGAFAVAFKDAQTGEQLLIHERERFHAASTMKTPVMIEVFRQVAEGKFKLNDSILIKNEFKSIVDGSPYSLNSTDDSELTLYGLVGKKVRIYEVMYLMITASSNLATNLIIEWVDAAKVTRTMRSLGAMDIEVLRGVEDSKAFAKGLNNTVTAFDLMIIYDQLAKRKIIGKTPCDQMTAILRDQKSSSIIPALLPADVLVAHKTGWIRGVQHDSGFVILPDGRRYTLVILSKNLTDEPTAVQAMARISRLVYDYEAQKH